ncbi:hypothetical protein CERSUDRAFT_117694, partial [Gelatoporia subvermispora B]
MTSSTHRAELTPSQQLLKQTLYSQCPADVKFWAFSRRVISPSGDIRVDRPIPVYASSIVVKEVEALNRTLCGGFQESTVRTTLDSGFPERADPYTDEYDYDSDSDLDDEDDGGPAIGTDYVGTQRFEERQSSQADRATALGVQQQSDRRDPASCAGNSLLHTFPAAKVNTTRNDCYEIILKDVSVHTWRAFLFYLYTGEVDCLPLRSQPGEVREKAFRLSLSNKPRAPPCSAKSLYRLGDKYDLPHLKMKALVALRNNLTVENIIPEVFSRFTSRYDEVAIGNVFAEMSKGQLPFASEALKLVLDANFSATQPELSRTPT